VALVGYGKMGRAVESAALARRHGIARRIDPTAPGAHAPRVSPEILAGVDVAFEFSAPRAAFDNVSALLSARVPVVCGTTGWSPQLDAARARAKELGVGFLWSPNYSLGVQLTLRLVERAAAWFGALPGFAPYLVEEHHSAKADAPSGTARRLADVLVARTPGKRRWDVAPADGPVPPEVVPVAWIRAGSIPGTHRAGFDAAGETVEIVHRARDRSVFAAGAVLAAEWVVDRQGPCTMDEMLDDILG
jgi:4-hydroxy-tetrahydrodipicolinate reductase